MPRKKPPETAKPHPKKESPPEVETWGHDTFMCGLDFLNLDLRYYRHGLLAKLVTFLYFDSNHSKLAQTTTFVGVLTPRHILKLGDGSVA